MAGRVKKAITFPKFANESEEADWWASPMGREYVKRKSAEATNKPAGLKLVAKLARANSVQIALRLPSPDLDTPAS